MVGLSLPSPACKRGYETLVDAQNGLSQGGLCHQLLAFLTSRPQRVSSKVLLMVWQLGAQQAQAQSPCSWPLPEGLQPCIGCCPGIPAFTAKHKTFPCELPERQD